MFLLYCKVHHETLVPSYLRLRATVSEDSRGQSSTNVRGSHSLYFQSPRSALSTTWSSLAKIHSSGCYGAVGGRDFSELSATILTAVNHCQISVTCPAVLKRRLGSVTHGHHSSPGRGFSRSRAELQEGGVGRVSPAVHMSSAVTKQWGRKRVSRRHAWRQAISPDGAS